MHKLSSFMVNKRGPILAVMVLAAIVCAFLAVRVETNTDMTKYLSDSSNMKQGLERMEEEFPETAENYSIRVMFEQLSETQKTEVLAKLQSIPYVETVDYNAEGGEYNKGEYTLYVVNTSYAYDSEEEASIEAYLSGEFQDFSMEFRNNATPKTKVTAGVLAAALACLLVILFLMSPSWLEPVLFLITIGFAIVINLGTNLFLGYTADITVAIGPVLQLVLSMDYSIILMNRYRQESERFPNRYEAMKEALAKSFSSIVSSAMTTVVGLLALVFLNFKIGGEFGIVLAKGVFISMLCVFTILPTLILFFEKGIKRTAKKTLHIPMKGLAGLSYRLRFVVPVVFVLCFAGFFILQNNTKIIFTEGIIDPLAEVFPKDNTVILLYENDDEENVDGIIAELEKDVHIRNISGYTNTIGKRYTATEMLYVMSMMMNNSPVNAAGNNIEAGTAFVPDESMLSMIYYNYFHGENGQADPAWKMSLQELFCYLSEEMAADEQFRALLGMETIELIKVQSATMEAAATQLKGETVSRLILTTDYPEESESTTAFMETLDRLMESRLTKPGYLIGTSAMVHEMEEGFRTEFNLITILTALAIFLVVLLTFRSAAIPVLLVLLVQCGVYITVTVIGWQGYSVYYLALLIVQSILMGATIDYAIVFTNYYREHRKLQNRREAIKEAYEHSIHTILTSGLILILVTGILGKFIPTRTISQVCSTISIGSLSAVLLILLILPGTLVFLDRFVAGKGRKRET